MALSPETQKKLFAETDARFAAQTGITRKLDPHNATDKPFVPVWTDIYNKVLRDYQAGILAWTHDNPFVQNSLGAASILADKSAGHFDDAAKAAAAGLEAGIHLAQAEAARAASQIAAYQAATAQPPTVDPTLAAAAAQIMAANALTTAQTPHDAVAAAQGVAAGGQALGVHTPGDPNALHFTMPGGQQSAADYTARQQADMAHGQKGVATAALAVGGGLLLTGLVFNAFSGGKSRSRGGGGHRRRSASNTYIVR